MSQSCFQISNLDGHCPYRESKSQAFWFAPWDLILEKLDSNDSLIQLEFCHELHIWCLSICRMAAQCLALLLHSKKALGCVEFACLLHAEKLGCSKLPVEANVSVNGCFSLYISPVMNWKLIQSVARPSTNVSWNHLQRRWPWKG